MSKKNLKIGIIGFGSMGKALSLALKRKQGVCVHVFDSDQKKTKTAKGLRVSKNIKELIKSVDIVILAVKPRDIKSLLTEIRTYLTAKKLLFISIAAGISTRLIQNSLGKQSILRVMPNLAAKVGESTSFISKGEFASKKDLDIAKKIFQAVGEAFVIQENHLDKITAVSGSGPGYIFYFMNALYEAALELGFTKSGAEEITTRIFWGSVKLAEESKEDFKSLIAGVASKGGTTEAALEIFEKKKVRGAIKDGVRAAYKRAKKMGLR